jgi:hypothetical protein
MSISGNEGRPRRSGAERAAEKDPAVEDALRGNPPAAHANLSAWGAAKVLLPGSRAKSGAIAVTSETTRSSRLPLSRSDVAPRPPCAPIGRRRRRRAPALDIHSPGCCVRSRNLRTGACGSHFWCFSPTASTCAAIACSFVSVKRGITTKNAKVVGAAVNPMALFFVTCSRSPAGRPWTISRVWIACLRLTREGRSTSHMG